VIAAFEAAGKGTMQLDGVMLDAPHLAQARRIIASWDRGQIRQRPNTHRCAWPPVAWTTLGLAAPKIAWKQRLRAGHPQMQGHPPLVRVDDIEL
jgi:hypothetical protein